MGVPQSTVHDIIKKDLKLNCLTNTEVQELTSANKLANLDRPLERVVEIMPAAHVVDFIWFSDEKLNLKFNFMT